MIKTLLWSGLATGLFLTVAPVHAEDPDPMVCVNEIEHVCVHLEDHLETCLTQRGDQLSASCRSALQTAMSAMQNSDGPAACVPDVQRLCPNLKSSALGQCITEKQSQLSNACQKYLQTASQK